VSAAALPRGRAQARLGLLLALPALVVTIVFFVFPLGSAVYFSMTEWNGATVEAPFVGLQNFTDMASDDEALNALGHNAIWVTLGTIVPIVVGLLLAVLLWSGVAGVLAYRLVFFLPYILPAVVVAIVWGWIYDPLQGWLNEGLEAVALSSLTRGWLGDPDTALYAVLVAAMWSAFGFAVVIFLAALQNVDLDLIDAARIDGAGAARRLWHVILPQITPVALMATTVILVGGFSVFDIVLVMTGGGPANASEVLGTYAYENAFQLNRVGYGTAIALLITALSLPFVILLNRLQRRLSARSSGEPA
jgi:raffinose/stachyose/melibiose transport system permease protein